MSVAVGSLLKAIRIKAGLTLRKFCLDRGLEAIRYSLIERGELPPDVFEISQYLNLVEEKSK